jgi:hypothetical protein
MINLITISTEYGAGGGDLAKTVGATMKWPVFDDNLVHLVAERLQFNDDAVRMMDEVPPSLVSRLVSILLLIKPPELLHQVDTSDLIRPEVVADVVRSILLELVEHPPLIVVGHGAQCLFQNRSDSIHIRLVASLTQRKERVISREPTSSLEDAEGIIHRVDTARARYIRHYYDADIQNALMYSFVINTSVVSIDESAAAIVKLINDRR